MRKALLAIGALIVAATCSPAAFAQIQLDKNKVPQLKPGMNVPAPKPTKPLCTRPQLDSVAPYVGPVGTTVTLTGRCFGATLGRNFVSLNHGIDGSRNRRMDIRSWSDTRIVAAIPGNALPDRYDVYVHSYYGDRRRTSNKRVFTVRDANAAPKPGVAAQLKPGVNVKQPGPTGPQVTPRRIAPLACTIDPAVNYLRVIHPRRIPDGSYVFYLHATIKNLGTEAFESGANQARYTLRWGTRVLASRSFTRLAPGQSMDVGMNIQGWRLSDEFPADYTLEIVYDPDIRADGNPKNDDCRMNNNKKTLRGADVMNVLRTAPSVPTR